jgi:hypothetical protein
VRQALSVLPDTLKDTYADMLDRVCCDDHKFVSQALLWVSFAKRPLKLCELNEVVVVEESDTEIDEESMLTSPDIILTMCKGLITLEMDQVSLAHSSVKEFLTSDWITSSKVARFTLHPSTADRIIMRKCLTYLCLKNFQSGYISSADLLQKRLEINPFLRYAADFWAVHGSSCVLNEEDRELVDRFFNTKMLPFRGNFGLWVQILIPEVPCSEIETTEPLYYAASFGLVSVVKAIVEFDSNASVDKRGGRFRSTPLFVACWRLNLPVVEILLEAGANPNIRDHSTGYTAFSLARSPRFRELEPILGRCSKFPEEAATLL